MTSAVVLATAYPPTEGASAMRARNLARSLQEAGFSVTVYAPRGPNHASPPEAVPVSWVNFEHLGKQLGLKRLNYFSKILSGPHTVRENVIRTAARRVLIPDLYVSWIPDAFMKAKDAVRDATLVLSTGAPSSHVVACLLSRRGVWIADINDLWWQNPHVSYGPLRNWIDHTMENGVLGRATALTTVNDVMSAELQRRFGAPVMPLYSGYEPDEFVQDPGGVVEDTVPSRELLFAGTLYPAFDVAPILDGLARAKGEGWLSPDDLRVTFVGGGSWRATVEAERRHVSEYVAAVPTIERQELLRRLPRASALILPLYDIDPYSLPMRFFEYVGSGRPIIAVGPPSRLPARLVREHGLGLVASSGSEFASVLRRVANDDLEVFTDRQERVRFSRRQMAPRLQQLLVDVAAVPG